MHFPHASIFICPIAIAPHGTDYKITGVSLSVCLSVCLSVVAPTVAIFESNLMKLCTVVWGQKTKIEFVMGQNPIMPSPILPQIFTNIFATPNAFSTRLSKSNAVSTPVDRLYSTRPPRHTENGITQCPPPKKKLPKISVPSCRLWTLPWRFVQLQTIKECWSDNMC